jgi:hypothetical protein
MIQMPQRSVTRFFIPLIDVLTLLFCIYLLMPLASSSKEDPNESDPEALKEQVRKLKADLEQTRANQGSEIAAQLRQDIERLQTEKVRVLQQRLTVRVLEIDGQTGKLYYRDPERIEIPNQAAAQELIDRDQKQKGVGQKELYYLILYPREPNTGVPTNKQKDDYDRWFKSVALGYDIPGGEAKR